MQDLIKEVTAYQVSEGSNTLTFASREGAAGLLACRAFYSLRAILANAKQPLPVAPKDRSEFALELIKSPEVRAAIEALYEFKLLNTFEIEK